MKNKASKKGEILWSEVRYYDFFESEVGRIRVMFGIPMGGSGKDDLGNLPSDQRYSREIGALATRCMKELRRNHGITTDPFPHTLKILIQYYVQDGPKRAKEIIDTDEQLNPFGCGLIVDIAEFTPEQLHGLDGKIIIAIDPHASRDDVINFVTKQWRAVRYFKPSVPRIRKRTAEEEHKIIRELYALTKRELCEKFSVPFIKGQTKCEIIGAEMELSPEAIEKIVSKRAKK